MDPPLCDNPLNNFIGNFIIDISNGFALAIIRAKFLRFFQPTYDANKPKNSLNSIANDFKNCIEPDVGSAAIITATNLAESIFYIVILTAVFLVLVVIIIELLDNKEQGGIIIAIILFFALLYIIIGWLLIHNSFLIISNQITIVEQTTDRCLQNFINDIELYFLNQESAIDKALCSYPIRLDGQIL